jgi:hypothetical protein
MSAGRHVAPPRHMSAGKHVALNEMEMNNCLLGFKQKSRTHALTLLLYSGTKVSTFYHVPTCIHPTTKIYLH